MRPVPGDASRSGSALPPICFLGYRRFVGLRSFPAVSSVASGRIEFVLQAALGLSVLRTSLPLPVALHLTSRPRSYFQLPGGKLRRWGTLTLCASSLPSALEPAALRPVRPRSAGGSDDGDALTSRPIPSRPCGTGFPQRGKRHLTHF